MLRGLDMMCLEQISELLLFRGVMCNRKVCVHNCRRRFLFNYANIRHYRGYKFNLLRISNKVPTLYVFMVNDWDDIYFVNITMTH